LKAGGSIENARRWENDACEKGVMMIMASMDRGHWGVMESDEPVRLA